MTKYRVDPIEIEATATGSKHPKKCPGCESMIKWETPLDSKGDSRKRVLGACHCGEWEDQTDSQNWGEDEHHYFFMPSPFARGWQGEG